MFHADGRCKTCTSVRSLFLLATTSIRPDQSDTALALRPVHRRESTPVPSPLPWAGDDKKKIAHLAKVHESTWKLAQLGELGARGKSVAP